MKLYFYFIFILFTFLYPKIIKVSFNDDSRISYKGSHPAHDWVGISDRIKGGLLCKDSSLDECVIKIAIPLKSFDSNSSGRDSNMLIHTESNKYPFVKFISDSFNMKSLYLEESEDIIKSDGESEVILTGSLEFHGVQKNISINLQLSKKEDMFLGMSEFAISLDDYNVEKPQLLLVPISDEIIISCKLFCNNEFYFSKYEKK